MATTPLQALPVPSLSDPPNGPAQFSAFGNAVEKQLVMRFATVAARDAAIIAPVAGMIAYVVADDTFYFHNGTAWSARYAPLVRTGVWTPALTNIVIGTGGGAANVGAYTYHAGILEIDIVVLLGAAGFSVTGTPVFSLPAGFTLDRVNTLMVSPLAVGLIAGASFFEGIANQPSTSTISVLVKTASGPYVSRSGITNLVPATWAAGDGIFINGTLKGTLV